jgi:cellulose synthase/poly-beta-1,6-N-acetylglucosamine synthase-like glycosyltransferase
MAELVFWISVGLVGYVYLGYPLLLLFWSRIRPRPVAKGPYEPAVSLLIVAHNERGHMARKLASCFELDYPPEKLQILVSLDGPTDGTDLLLHQPELRGIDVVHLPQHCGKAAALNCAVVRAAGEILVFTDARQRLDKAAIRRLVENFADPTVGAVTGKLVLDDGPGRGSAGVGLYWRYERLVRAMEGLVHSVIGATGALYAVRKSLYRELPEEAILDDVAVPLGVVLSGRRVVMDEAAIVYDRLSGDMRHEYRRKVRTLAGNFQLLSFMPELLNPRRNPVLLQLVSHKLARLVVPYFVLLAYASSLFLEGSLYAVAFAFELALPACAFLGFTLASSKHLRKARERGGLASLAARGLVLAWTFLMLNGAAVAGLYHFLASGPDLRRRLWSGEPPGMRGLSETG